ncbi:hypothetical protein D3C80_2144740 [compost metagenome]
MLLMLKSDAFSTALEANATPPPRSVTLGIALNEMRSLGTCINLHSGIGSPRFFPSSAPITSEMSAGPPAFSRPFTK